MGSILELATRTFEYPYVYYERHNPEDHGWEYIGVL